MVTSSAGLAMVNLSPKILIRSASVLCIIILLISFIYVVLDKHRLVFSSTCAVCQVKVCPGDLWYSSTIKYYPAIAYHNQDPYIHRIDVFYPVHLKNKAPPIIC